MAIADALRCSACDGRSGCMVGVANELLVYVRTSIKARLGPSPALCQSFLRGPLYILRGIFWPCLFILFAPHNADLFFTFAYYLRVLFFWFYTFRYLYCSYLQDCWRPFTIPYACSCSSFTFYTRDKPWQPRISRVVEMWRATPTRTTSLFLDHCFVFILGHHPLLFPHTFWRTSPGTRDRPLNCPCPLRPIS